MRQPKIYRKSLGVMVGMVLALGLASTPALAAPGPSQESRHFAKQNAESIVKASEEDYDGEPNAAWVNSFSGVVTRLSESYPDDFAASEMDAISRQGWVGFKGEVPADAQEILAEQPGIEVRSDIGYSMQEMDDYIAELSHEAAKTAGSGGEATAVQVGNDAIIEVNVHVREDIAGKSFSPLSATDEEDIQRALDETAPPFEGPELDIRLSVSDEPLGEDQDHTAGGKINVTVGSNTYICTAAFPIKRNGGSEIGVLTAGHCRGPGPWKYNTTPNAFYSPYPNSQSTTTGSSTGGDFRWHHSKSMFNGRTYVGKSGQSTIFVAAHLASVGNGMCVYGRTSARTCSTVKAINQAYTIAIPDAGEYRTISPLIQLKDGKTLGGDSGGPWYYGTSAYGIHSGLKDGLSVGSRLPNALRKLNVSLWTGA